MERYNKGDQYRTLNCHSSAISAFHMPVSWVKVGQHESVRHIMSAFFNVRPPMPKYTVTWDVDNVLSFIRDKRGANATLSAKDISLKLSMLMALISFS